MEDRGDPFVAPSYEAAARAAQPWQAAAACADQGTELFVTEPTTNGGTAPRKAAKAMRVCAGCSVRVECLRDSLHAFPGFEAWGTWGGTQLAERRAILRSNYPRDDRAQFLRNVESFIVEMESTFAERLAALEAAVVEMDERMALNRVRRSEGLPAIPAPEKVRPKRKPKRERLTFTELRVVLGLENSAAAHRLLALPGFPPIVSKMTAASRLWDAGEVRAWAEGAGADAIAAEQGHANRGAVKSQSSPTTLKHFHLRGPGPGRGHRGPIAEYAARHGVSRSTAWRRLKAAA